MISSRSASLRSSSHASIFCPRFSQKQSANQPFSEAIVKTMIVSNRAWWRTRATICRRSFQSIKNTRPLRRVVKRRKYSKPALNQRIWLALLGGLNRHIDFSCEQKDNKEKRKKKAKKKQVRKFRIWTDTRKTSTKVSPCTRVNRLRHVNTCSPPDENLNNSFFLFRFVASIAYASIFCPRFSQKQSANQAKKLQGNVFLLNWKAQAKIQVLLKKKKIYPKKSLTTVLHQAIQL